MKRVQLILLFTFVTLLSFGQNYLNTHIQRIPSERGLSNKVIPAIVQDEEGYIWIATQEGLNRYDGYNFKVYQRDPSDKNSLSSDNIFCMFLDEDGIFWLGTEGGGLTRFDPKEEQFTQYLHKDSDPYSIADNEINCIKQGPNGKLWLGFWNNGISIFDPETGKCEQISNEEGNAKSLANHGVWDIFFGIEGYALVSLWNGGVDKINLKTKEVEHLNHDGTENGPSHPISGLFLQDKKDRIWLTSWGGCLNQYLPSSNTFKHYRPTDIAENDVRAWPIVETSEGNLVLCIYGYGLYEFNPESETFRRIAWKTRDKWSLPHNDAWSLYYDRASNLWIGAEGGGISLLPSAEKKFYHFVADSSTSNSIAVNSVRDIDEDDNGNIWIATWNGSLDKYDPSNGIIQNYSSPLDPAGKVRTVYAYENDIWFGSYRQGLGRLDSNGVINYRSFDPDNKFSLSHNYILDIHVDSKGNFWVATVNGLNLYHDDLEKFERFHEEKNNLSSISNNTVNVIFEDRSGNVYFGTDLGLCKYLAGKGFQRLSNSNDPSYSSIYAITEDNDGNLWMATKKGLTKRDPNGNYESFNASNGLPANFIKSLEFYDNHLWIGTVKGLSKFDLSTNTFVNYNQLDGLANYFYMPNSSCLSSKGVMYFGGTEGLDYFKAEEINDNDYVIPIHFTDFALETGESQDHFNLKELQTIELDYDENIFSISFVGLNFDRPDKNQYAYQLVGVNDDWVYCGTQRTARFSGLSPGEYEFKVKACNNDGLWAEAEHSLKVIIYPPFWETWWFRILVLILITAAVVTIYRYRMRAIKKRNQELEETVAERTREVVMQKEEIEEQHREIKDSIAYAKRLQDAILPPLKRVKSTLPESFIVFRPKDVVSGDFYWMEEVDNKIFFAAADCTGHGVPGAMVSVVCSNALNRAVKEFGLRDVGQILDKVTDLVIERFEQSEAEVKDGMDIALCCIDKTDKTLKFAGANNPLWLMRSVTGNEDLTDKDIFDENYYLVEYKATKQPVGKYANRAPFETNTIEYSAGDELIIFSDGMADQFGGDKGKKMKYKPFKRYLLTIKDKPIEEQHDLLIQNFLDWMGDFEQIDDVVVIGVKL